MPLYSPFVERNIDKVAGSMMQAQQSKLAQSAYMGDSEALGQLYGSNPQLAQRITQQKEQQKQNKLANQAAQQKQNREADKHTQTIARQIAKDVSKMDFDQAQSYAAQQAQTYGVDLPPLTLEHHEQFKQAFSSDGETTEIKNRQDLINRLPKDESGNLITDPKKMNAEQRMAAIDAGILPRAMASADTTTAQDQELADKVIKFKGDVKESEGAGSQSGRDTEKTRTARIDVGAAAAKGIPTLVRALELLERVETGGPEAISLRLKQKLGIEGADEGELSNKLGKAVLSQLRETFGAAFTEREGDRLDSIEANFGKSNATNKRLLNELFQFATKQAEQAIEDAESRRDFDTAHAIRESMAFVFDENSPLFADGVKQEVLREIITPNEGEIQDGYRFKGGDPANPNSWERL